MVYLCRIPGWGPDKQVIYYPVLVFGEPVQDMCDFLFSNLSFCFVGTEGQYQEAKADRYYDEWHVIVVDTDANIQIFFLFFRNFVWILFIGLYYEIYEIYSASDFFVFIKQLCIIETCDLYWEYIIGRI